MSIRNRLFKHIGPKTRLSQGVLCMARTPDGKLLVGAGDGSISVIHPETLKVPPHLVARRATVRAIVTCPRA